MSLTTAALQSLKPLPCQREWFERHVTVVLKQLHGREYRCPECEGQYLAGLGMTCEVCRGWGTVFFEQLEEYYPEHAERVKLKALARGPR